MAWRMTVIWVVLAVMLSGCSLVEDRPASIADGPTTTNSVGDGPTTTNSVGDGPTTTNSVGDGPTTTNSVGDGPTTTDSVGIGQVPAETRPVPPGSDPTAPAIPRDEELPPICLDMTRFLFQSTEFLTVPTGAEAVRALRALRVTLASIESTGDPQFLADARALLAVLDGILDDVDPSRPAVETRRLVLPEVQPVAANVDRLTSRGIDRCGGSDVPPTPALEGIRLLTGEP